MNHKTFGFEFDKGAALYDICRHFLDIHTFSSGTYGVGHLILDLSDESSLILGRPEEMEVRSELMEVNQTLEM